MALTLIKKADKQQSSFELGLTCRAQAVAGLKGIHLGFRGILDTDILRCLKTAISTI